MQPSSEITVVLPAHLHARPAGKLARAAAGFACETEIEFDGQTASANGSRRWPRRPARTRAAKRSEVLRMEKRIGSPSGEVTSRPPSKRMRTRCLQSSPPRRNRQFGRSI